MKRSATRGLGIVCCIWCRQTDGDGHPHDCFASRGMSDDVLLTARTICQYMTVCFQLALSLLTMGCGARGWVRGKPSSCEGWIFVQSVWRGQGWVHTAPATWLKPWNGNNGENPVSSTQLCQTAGESCQHRRPNLTALPSSSHSDSPYSDSLWQLFKHSILSCLEVESKRKNESALASVNKKHHSFFFFPSCLCASSKFFAF